VTSSSTLAVGLMSGTSLDGVDAALVRLTGDRPAAELAAFRSVPYEPAFRVRLLELIDHGWTRDAALLHVELGARFANAVAGLLAQAGIRAPDVAFVASHGQTVWHEPGLATLQLGDPAVIAERIGVPVVSDFRARDVAAGGQGAPLVPIADALLFAAPDRPRVLLNIGGMANVTWVPPGGAVDRVTAFDTGPGVAVVDAVVRLVRPGQAFDTDGALALAGRADEALVSDLLGDPFFVAPPPKSTGRETFGDAFARGLVREIRARRPEAADQDCVATATALTVATIADQVRRWLPADGAEIVASGGGVRNPAIVGGLTAALAGRPLSRFDDLFFDGDAKEAVAFALLGWLTLRNRTGNVPGATGARGPRVLGRVTPA
jgi:anhydro-N-acetylmuramic acid kinase